MSLSPVFLAKLEAAREDSKRSLRRECDTVVDGLIDLILTELQTFVSSSNGLNSGHEVSATTVQQVINSAGAQIDSIQQSLSDVLVDVNATERRDVSFSGS